MLKPDLKESNIPGRTTLHDWILELFEEHLDTLEEEMKVWHQFFHWSYAHQLQKSLGKISFTTDVWSDTNQTPFMAITAHWVAATTSSGQYTKLSLRADLIGFIHVPGWHTGEHLAHAFLHTLDRINITEKVVPLSNYSIKALLISIFFYVDWLGNFGQRIQ